jgi:hypothetical protein
MEAAGAPCRPAAVLSARTEQGRRWWCVVCGGSVLAPPPWRPNAEYFLGWGRGGWVVPPGGQRTDRAARAPALPSPAPRLRGGDGGQTQDVFFLGGGAGRAPPGDQQTDRAARAPALRAQKQAIPRPGGLRPRRKNTAREFSTTNLNLLSNDQFFDQSKRSRSFAEKDDRAP